MVVPVIIPSPRMPSQEVSAAFLRLYPSVSSLEPHIPSQEAVQSVTAGIFRYI